MEEDRVGELNLLAVRTLKKFFNAAIYFFGGSLDNPVSQAFEFLGGLDAMEKLQYHNSHKVYISALNFLERFFETLI
jgi:hypothetical protein